MTVAGRLNHWVRSLGRRDLEIMGLPKTLIVRHASKSPEPALLELAVMAFRPDQGQVAPLVLGAELTICSSVNHLRVVVVALGVNLV